MLLYIIESGSRFPWREVLCDPLSIVRVIHFRTVETSFHIVWYSGMPLSVHNHPPWFQIKEILRKKFRISHVSWRDGSWSAQSDNKLLRLCVVSATCEGCFCTDSFSYAVRTSAWTKRKEYRCNGCVSKGISTQFLFWIVSWWRPGAVAIICWFWVDGVPYNNTTTVGPGFGNPIANSHLRVRWYWLNQPQLISQVLTIVFESRHARLCCPRHIAWIYIFR